MSLQLTLTSNRSEDVSALHYAGPHTTFTDYLNGAEEKGTRSKRAGVGLLAGW